MEKPLNELLVRGIGKKEISAIAEHAVTDDELFEGLLRTVETGEKTPAMKAAWIIGTASEVYDAAQATTYASRILQLVVTETTSGIVRELMKALIKADLDEKSEGLFLDFCFKSLSSNVDVAVKYTANKAIEQALKKYPDLKDEFIAVLESQLYANTEAWTRYTMKIISRLNKRRNK